MVKRFIANTLRVIFSIVAIIALIPTNAMRWFLKDEGYHLNTKNKGWDFLFGLIISLLGTIGVSKAAEFNLWLIYSRGIPLNEFLLYHLAGLVFLIASLISWGLMMYGIIKSSRIVIKTFWEVEL